jgi:hypothetical protein
MKRTRRSLLGVGIVAIVTLAVVMVAHHNVVQANDDGCNASTIKGAYGFAIGGLASSSFSGNPQQIGEFVPLAAAGTFSFDGHGTTSRSFTLSYGGAIFPVSDSGPYTVNSDCTVSNIFGWHLEHGYYRPWQGDQGHERLPRSRGARNPHQAIVGRFVPIYDEDTSAPMTWHR